MKITKTAEEKSFLAKILFSTQISIIITMTLLLSLEFLPSSTSIQLNQYKIPQTFKHYYIYIIFYLFFLIGLNKNLSINIRAYISSTTMFLAATAIFTFNGFHSSGPIFFAVASFITTIIISQKIGMALHILSVIIQIGISLLVMNGFHSFTNQKYNDLLHPNKIITIMFGYAMLVGIIIYYSGIKYQKIKKIVENELNIATKELSEQLDIINSIINSIPGLFFLFTMEGKLLRWNSQLKVITGYADEELANMSISDWFEKDNLKKILIAINKIKNNVTGQYIEADIKIKNGKKISFLFSGKKIILENRDHFLGIGIDISEKKLIEAELRQSQKMEMVGTMAGGLAHDFNNVIGGVTGALSIIKSKLIKNKPIEKEKLNKYVNIMENSCKRATNMVQQLLALSSKQDIYFDTIDLNRTAENIIKICENTFDKSIKIILKFWDEPAVVKADATQIEQIVLNFCVNANHAMTIMREKGEIWGGTLSLSINKLIADEIFLNEHPEAKKVEYWILSIEDTGVGMDKKIQLLIFNPFFTTKDTGKGTGLGLSMVYNIAKQHNGFIDVYSEIGLGSKFNLYLPVLQEEYKNKVDKEKIITPGGEGLLLFVDDEKALRTLAKDILEERGYDVITAGNGRECIEIFKERYSDIKVVILDMVMPEMSGKETYIKMKEIYPQVKVILSSGFKQDERVNETMKLGVNDFIHKPYNSEELLQIIHKI